MGALSVQGSSISEILRDETLINELQNSKRFFTEIIKRIDESKETERLIDESREMYRPVARACSLSYFTVLSMSCVENMYQWSLGWFCRLLDLASEGAEKNDHSKVERS